MLLSPIPSAHHHGAALLTGLHPTQNGQIGLATHKFAMYRKDTPNIATLLESAGYHTGLIGKLHVNPESAFPFDFRAIPRSNFNREYTVRDYAEGRGSVLQEGRISAVLPFRELP